MKWARTRSLVCSGSRTERATKLNLLLDTHLLLWAAAEPARLSTAARRLLQDSGNRLHFSVASLWEISIKSALGRPSFTVDVTVFRRNLLDNSYLELAIEAPHVLSLAHLPQQLPAIHKDPFDRMLIAQAGHEGMTLVSVDQTLAIYGSRVQLV